MHCAIDFPGGGANIQNDSLPWIMNVPITLREKSAVQLAEQLKGYPPGTVEAILRFRDTGADEDLLAAVLPVLEHHLPVKARRSLDGTAADCRVREDLGMDSLSMTEAVFTMEDIFGFVADSRELAAMQTIGEVLDYLKGKFADG